MTKPSSTPEIMFPLFVPADRPDRLGKACRAGADAVIIDLEDAVAPSDKEAVRAGLPEAIEAVGKDTPPLLLRINAVGTRWYADDVQMCQRLPLAAVMLPKVESKADIDQTRKAGEKPVFALIESANGVLKVNEIASVADRLVFGSIDFAADIGSAHSREALLWARSSLVAASRGSGLNPPIDGVTTAIHDGSKIEEDARYGASLGFGGKLLIHPAQILSARCGFQPSDEEMEWAVKVLAAIQGGSAQAVDGNMIDAPVLLRAQRIFKMRSGV